MLLLPHERRNCVQLLCLAAATAITDERTRVEARKQRVAIHRAQGVIQGCEDEIGRIYDELPGGVKDEDGDEIILGKRRGIGYVLGERKGTRRALTRGQC